MERLLRHRRAAGFDQRILMKLRSHELAVLANLAWRAVKSKKN